MDKYEILVDIDFKPESKRKLVKLAEDYSWKMYFISTSLNLVFEDTKVLETKKGFHFYHTVESKRPLTPLEIIIIQLALGSDYKREIFNLRRARAWLDGEELEDGWNVLFKYKYKKGKLVSQEFDGEKSRIIESYIKNRYNRLMESD